MTQTPIDRTAPGLGVRETVRGVPSRGPVPVTPPAGTRGREGTPGPLPPGTKTRAAGTPEPAARRAVPADGTPVRRRDGHKQPEAPPVLVVIHKPLLDTVRALYPEAENWTASQVVTACVALAIGRHGRLKQAG